MGSKTNQYDDEEYLSEDYAFCEYVRRTGSKVYQAMRPTVVHYGEYGYTTYDGIKGNEYVRYTNVGAGIDAGYPKPIAENWLED